MTSDPFAVKDAEVSGTQSAVGSLAAGFSFVLGDGTDEPIILGRMLDVSVTWDIILSNVSFYFRDCRVEQGNTAVTVIKDGCFSEALKVSPISGSPTNQAFQMMTFTIENEQSTEQFLICDLKLCMHNCDKPMSNGDCPDSAHYAFSVTGF